MSKITLNEQEVEMLASEGWKVAKTSDGPEFSMDLGSRKIVFDPVIKRLLKPAVFRSQARRFDSEYSKVAQAVGWGGRKFFPGNNKSQAMSKFLIEKFDSEFAKELTEILKDYALNADPKQLVADSIERRKKVRWSLSKADLIDYAYLRRTKDLEKISLEERDDGTEFISSKEDVECLRKAIEVSKRP